MAEGQFRLRIRYAKLSRLRYLSHLEVIRAVMRTIRRANLPYAVSQGFSPHMRAAFSSALPVGCAGLDEYVDVWLTGYVPVDAARAALVRAVPESMPVLACAYVDDAAPALTASYPLATYRALVDASGLSQGTGALRQSPVPVAPDGRAPVATTTCALVQDSIDRLLATGAIEVERKGKVKRLDLAKLIVDAPVARVSRPSGPTFADDCGAGGVPDDGAPPTTDSFVEIRFTTEASNEGSLRADVLLDAIARSAGMGLPVRWLCHESQTRLTEVGVRERPL